MSMDVARLIMLGIVLLTVPGCGTSPRGPERADVLTVVARIEAANGTAIGCSFGIVGKASGRVYKSGSTDNMGEIVAACRIPSSETEITVACISTRMVRNTQDEVLSTRDLQKRATMPWEMEDVFEGKVFVDYGTWERDGIHSWGDLLRVYGSEHSVTISAPGEQSIDSVARTVPFVGGSRVDVGVLRFPEASPAMEILLLLRDSMGAPASEKVTLGGFPFRAARSRPEKNRFYPQFALAQRGDRVRIIATEAGVMALLATGDRSFRLDVTSDGRIVCVSLPEFARGPASAMSLIGPVEVPLEDSPDEKWLERWSRLVDLESSTDWPWFMTRF